MMSTKKYRIRLTTDEQQELNALVSRGTGLRRTNRPMRAILLMSDESRSAGGMKDADITSALECGTVNGRANTQALCEEEGIPESALNRKKDLRRRQKRLDGPRR